MARRRRYERKPSKYEEMAILLEERKILKIDYQNLQVKDSLKTAFYSESPKKPEGILCIAWGRTNFNVGDVVSMKGRLSEDGVFLVWSYYVVQRNVNDS